MDQPAHRTDEPGAAPAAASSPTTGRAREPSPGDSLRFAAAARELARVTRAQRWMCPAFRSPPRLVGLSRTISRRRDGSTTVAVALRGRPWAAVLADMIEGVVAANRFREVAADRCRTALWQALATVAEAAA